METKTTWPRPHPTISIGFPSTSDAGNGWEEVGITVGYTCKRVSGKGRHRTDSWTGQRVWDTKNKRPKRVFVRHL
jgi:hypothetical protein